MFIFSSDLLVNIVHGTYFYSFLLYLLFVLNSLAETVIHYYRQKPIKPVCHGLENKSNTLNEIITIFFFSVTSI